MPHGTGKTGGLRSTGGSSPRLSLKRNASGLAKRGAGTRRSGIGKAVSGAARKRGLSKRGL